MIDIDWIFLLWFTLGIAATELSRAVLFAIKVKEWTCPYCAFTIRADNGEFLRRVKDSHLETHIS